MPVYTYAQMEELWIRAGGPRALAPIAAAIGEAESGGNSDAVNPTDNNGTQSSFGIWQISTGTHVPPSPNWADPAENASLAVGKWQGAGNSFSPWGTYDSGAYRAYLSGSTTPDPNVPGSPTQQIAQLTAAYGTDCALGFSGVHYGVFFGFGPGPTIGRFCLLSKSEVRALLAAGTLAAGAIVSIVGLGFLAVFALRYTAAGRVVQPVVTVTRDMIRSTRQASRYQEKQPAKSKSKPAADDDTEPDELVRFA